jgi:pimeloyl-ACP methyl ester carboxylesterase
MVVYDEFSMFHENAEEYGIPYEGPPTVRRESVEVPSGLRVSALVWGTAEPELVLVHGGAQNAHTWDTVALALGRPLVAVDLPGHGHSDWRPEHDYWPPSMADDLAVVVERLAPRAGAVVGMSLGGMTSICLAARHPHLVRRLGIVDVTPGTDHAKAEPIVAFVSGPEFFESYDEILARTIEHNPTRSETSLRRGVLHNARELPDGRWSWRYDTMRDWKMGDGSAEAAGPGPDFASLWDEVDRIRCPVALWLGGAWSVVGPEDTEEFRRRLPGADVVTVEGAGHSIQGDRPLELAALVEGLLARSA